MLKSNWNMPFHSFRASKAFTTLVVSIAFFTDMLLQNLVVPVLPYALHSRIGLSDRDEIQQWTSILSSAFGGALMMGSLLFGYLSDMVCSSRALFVFSLAVTFLSTLLFSLATSLAALMVARVLQGLSTSVVTTVGYVLLTEVVGSDSKELGKAMGFTSMAFSFGLMCGPVMGGFLYEYCGYFSMFYPIFGILLLEMVLRLMIIDEQKKKTDSPSKYLVPPAEPEYFADTAESQPLLKSDTPEGPNNAYKTLLLSPRFIVALIGLFLLNSLACGFDAVLVPYLHDTFDLHSSQAAALFLSLAAPMLLAPFLGALTDRFGPKFPTALGFTLAIPSLILLGLIDAVAPMLKFAVTLVALGLAFALTTPALRVDVSLVVAKLENERPGRFGPKGAYGRAFSLLNFMVAAASVVGPLFAGFMKVVVGWRALGWVNAGLCAAVLVLVIFVTGGKGRRKERAIEAEGEA